MVLYLGRRQDYIHGHTCQCHRVRRQQWIDYHFSTVAGECAALCSGVKIMYSDDQDGGMNV